MMLLISKTVLILSLFCFQKAIRNTLRSGRKCKTTFCLKSLILHLTVFLIQAKNCRIWMKKSLETG